MCGQERNLAAKLDEWYRCAPALVVACPRGDLRRVLRGDLDTAERSRCNTVGPLPAMTVRAAEELLWTYDVPGEKLATRTDAGVLLIEEVNAYMRIAKFAAGDAAAAASAASPLFLRKVNALLMFGADANAYGVTEEDGYVAAIHQTPQLLLHGQLGDGILVARALLESGTDTSIQTQPFSRAVRECTPLLSSVSALRSLANDGPETIYRLLRLAPSCINLATMILQVLGADDVTEFEREYCIHVIRENRQLIDSLRVVRRERNANGEIVEVDVTPPAAQKIQRDLFQMYVCLRIHQEGPGPRMARDKSQVLMNEFLNLMAWEFVAPSPY